MSRTKTRTAGAVLPGAAILRAPDINTGPLMAQSAVTGQHRAAPAVRQALQGFQTRTAGDAGSAGAPVAAPAAVAPPVQSGVETRAAAPVQAPAQRSEDAAASTDAAPAAGTAREVTVTSSEATESADGVISVSMALELRSQAASLGVAAEAERAMLAQRATPESVRSAILAAAASRQGQATAVAAGSAARAITCANENLRSRMANGILLRAGQTGAVAAADQAAAAEFRGMSFGRLAEEVLRARGESVIGLMSHQMISRAMAIGDFPAILGDAMNRVLQDPVAPYPRSFTQFSREVQATDFRPRNPVNLGQFGAFQETAEGAPARFLSTRDERQTYAVRNFEGIVGITYQAMVNDDLGAFDSMPQQLEAAAALTESTVFYSTLFAGMGPVLQDGNPLYHASRNNIVTPAAVPSVATLSAMRQAIRRQLDPNGQRLNWMPRYIVIPTTLETTVDQLFAGLIAGMSVARADVVAGNLGSLIPVVEPMLDDQSATAWYAFADPALGTFEHAYLEGRGYQLEEMGPQAVSGVFWKARRPFGCGVANPRGMARNAGA